MANYERPLSPHVMIYRWQYSNALSILNRLTGIFLTVGTGLFVYWLVAAAEGADAYLKAQALFANLLVKCALFLWLLSFVFHALNGIRHLVWDVGYGFEKPVARASGWAVCILTAVLTVAIWLLVLARLSAGAQGGLV